MNDFSKKLGIGIIGCGQIGQLVAKAVRDGIAGQTELIAAFDRNGWKAKLLAEMVPGSRIAQAIEDLLSERGIELIVEAASQEAVRRYIPLALRAKRDVMILSVGALADQELLSEIRRTAVEAGKRVYVPSGALVGVDGVKAAAIGRLNVVELIMSKPPKGWEGAPYVVDKKIDLWAVEKAEMIYDGTAAEAASLFPANVNIAVTLGLAGLGAEETRLKVVVDPSIDRNVHRMRVRGEFGEFSVEMRNVAIPENPRTSFLAAYSLIRKLKEVSEPVSIGT